MIPQEVDVDAGQSGDSAGGLLDVPLRHPVRIEDQAVTKIMSREELEQALRAIGAERYHDKHPFHKLLHGGKLNKGQVQAWALNRYCYQSAVPRKDAALISRCYDRQLRRDWIHRIEDHDGHGEEEGGIERWLVLTAGLGLDRDYVVSMKGALPATHFAVEAYVNFVREKTLVEAVASSLTELFAPKIHKERIAGMLENYHFISDDVMQYFKRRLAQAPRDADYALEYVKRNARTPEAQAAALDALRFKCNVLWSQLDALYLAYYDPGMIPPGAFVPEKV
jgi:pyrroloquinoline-quinone synthase